MRISTSSINNITTNSMGNAYKTYLDVINKIASNKNFTKVSENVVDATKVLKLNDQLAQLEQYQSNIQAATNEMNIAYDALGDITDEITAIKSLVVEASNATTTPDAAKAIAIELKERTAIIMDKMNTKYLDNYIFAGGYTQNPAYAVSEDGTETITYQGSPIETSARNLTISENTTFKYNISGEEILKEFTIEVENPDDGSITTEQSDFFKEMKKLDELLNSEPLDYEKIRNNLGTLDKSIESITQAQGEISAKVAKLDATSTLNENTIVSLTENKVNLEEVDITKAATELASAQTALQASYAIGTKVLGSVSLLDYI